MATTKASTPKNEVVKNEVFIVYTVHEEPIASSLQALLTRWGYRCFYCRQSEDRPDLSIATYISDLTKRLASADLVIFLVSQEFQGSAYSQGEIGGAMISGKPKMVLVLPPAGPNDVRRIAPMLEDYECIVADAGEQMAFFEKLRHHLASNLSASANSAPSDPGPIISAQQDLWNRMLDVMRDYSLNLPPSVGVRVWNSIQQNSLAEISIVENVKASLRSDREATELVLVGVSLKFSLALITRALKEYAAEVKDQIGGRSARRRKRLNITLVYMDDLSNILHTLGDACDIDAIRLNLNQSKDNRALWAGYCKNTGIVMAPIVERRIDYIPPRVGLLIDGQKLYLGQCYFEPAGNEFGNTKVSYRLLVGERPYSFHCIPNGARGDRYSPDLQAIMDFRSSVNVYSDSRNNGVMLALNKSEWIERLRNCIASYEDVSEVTLISETGSKFDPLIDAAVSVAAARHGVNRVKVYVRDPTDLGLSDDARSFIPTLPARLRGHAAAGAPDRASIELYYYHHEPTFRAALIGNAVLGVQNYERMEEDGVQVMRPGPLRIITARYSAQFPGLKDMVDRFLKMSTVEEHPAYIV